MAGDIANLCHSTFSYPWQLPSFMASFFLSPEINLSPVTTIPVFTGVIVTGNKFIAGVVVIAGINDTGDH
jgi:hypothetical protein